MRQFKIFKMHLMASDGEDKREKGGGCNGNGGKEAGGDNGYQAQWS